MMTERLIQRLQTRGKLTSVFILYFIYYWVCQSALYADIGNDDDICLPCGRLPGVTSRVLIASVESTPRGSLLCHLKLETNLASAGIEPGSPDSRPDTHALGHETPFFYRIKLKLHLTNLNYTLIVFINLEYLIFCICATLCLVPT